MAGALITSPVGIRVTWTAPTYTGGCAISGYKIQWSSNGGSTWSAAKSDGGSPVDITKASPDNLTAGTTYVFRVAAENLGGIGAYSNVSAAVVTPPVPTIPDPPTAVLTTSPDGIRVTYDPPSGSTVTNYVIERSADGGAYGNPLNDTASPLDIAAASLASSTDYRFKVSAENAWGSSPFSNASNLVSTPNGPAKPDAPTVEAQSNSRTLRVTWPPMSPAPSGGYSIRQSSNGGATWTTVTVAAGVLTYDFTARTPGTTYITQLAGRDDWGNGPFSDSTTTIAPTGPAKPAPPTVSALTNARTLQATWTGTAANGYTVRQSGDGGTNWTSATVAAGVFTSNFTTRTPGTTYITQLAWIDAWGTGPFSNSTTTVAPTGPAKPAPPTVSALTNARTLRRPGRGLLRMATRCASPVTAGRTGRQRLSPRVSSLATSPPARLAPRTSPSWRGSMRGVLDRSRTRRRLVLRRPARQRPPMVRMTNGRAQDINVTWTNVTGATGYTINVSDPSTTNVCAAGWSATNRTDTATPYRWNNLTNNSYYCFRVSANNIWGTSGWSATAGPERAD